MTFILNGGRIMPQWQTVYTGIDVGADETIFGMTNPKES